MNTNYVRRNFMIRVSDEIGDRYLEWVHNAKGMFVLLRAGCGRGKTYFVIKFLLPYAIRNGKKVSIYVPRKSLRLKIIMDVIEMLCVNKISLEEINSSVCIRTYQELETMLKNGIKIPKSDINIVEEASYFYDDSLFSNSTNLSYHYLSSEEGRAALNFWISGTGTRIFERLIADYGLRRYRCTNQIERCKFQVEATQYSNSYEMIDLQGDYSWLDVKYLESDFDICELIKTDIDSKWAFFLDSKKKGKEYYEALKAAGYSVAYLNADNFEQEQEVANSIASIDKFKEKILLTTAVIESGNDLSELELRNIVVFSATKNRFLQMVSRRRRQCVDDKIRLFIPKRDYAYFEWCLEEVMAKLNVFAKNIFQNIETASEAINILSEAKQSEIDKLLAFFGATDKGLAVNELLLDELIYERDFYKSMAKKIKLDEHAFIKEQLLWMNISEQFSENNYIRNDITVSVLEEIMEAVRKFGCSKERFSCDEISKFIESLAPLVKKISTKRVKGGFKRPKMEEFCKDYNLPIVFEHADVGKTVYYSVHVGAWPIEEDGKVDEGQRISGS